MFRGRRSVMFFFFKQKTAYEMRIGDWSSDVCSSDLPMLSMGQLAKPGQAIAWRGPMAGNALPQLVDAKWDDVDILLVDLPPGTVDVQLSMIQTHKQAGAVIILNPQEHGLIHATRAVNPFGPAAIPLNSLVQKKDR